MTTKDPIKGEESATGRDLPPSIVAALLFLLAVCCVMLALAGPEASASPLRNEAPAPFRDGTVLLAFQNGVPPATEQAIIGSVGVELKRIGVGVHVVRVPPGRVLYAIRLLGARPEIRYAEPDYIQSVAGGAVPNDSNFGVQWAFQNTGQTVNGSSGTAGADESGVPAWTVSTGGNAVVVTVLDTGVQYSHPDLTTNIWNNPGGIGGCAAGTHGYNVLSSDCDPLDDDTAYGGHGTHIAGIIGAVGNNAAGVTGANWTATIMAVKWIQDNGGAVGLDSDLISGMDWIISAKQAGVNVRVVNDSATWPGTGFSQAVSDEIDLLGSNDILFVTAAGNTGQNNDATPRYPCSYNRPNMICVAMTDQNDNLPSASNYGLNSVELAAPGANIFSTLRQSNYGYISGTSMSAGEVSGAAALILSLGYQSVANLKSTILASVDQLPSLTNFVSTGGRLDLCKAVGCGSAATAVPAILSAPQITGIVQFGSVIGASTGMWSGKPTSFSYQWYRCNGGCQPINGATSANYAVLADADVGSTLVVSVTASNSSGAATASSAASATVASVTPPFTLNSTVTDGAVLSGNVTWQVFPTVPVNFVEFLIDGVLAQTDAVTPYIYNNSTTGVLDTTQLSNGTHVLGVVALAYSDNETYAFYGATVTINNQGGPTPTPTPGPTPTTNQTATPTPLPTPTPTPMPGQVVFVSAGNNVTSGGTSTTAISVPAPASIQANDLILVQATDYWGNALNPPDSSWHLIRTDILANHAVVRSFWHLATAAGDGPWTFTTPNDYISARACAWRNVDTTTPVDSASGGTTWANANSMLNVAVTPTASNETMVAYWSAYLATSQTLDAGLSSAYSAHDADWAMMVGYTAAPAAGVASAQYTSTSNASTNGGAGGVILLRGGSGAVTPTPNPTPSSTQIATSTSTPTPTATPTSAPTGTPTPTPAPTATPVPSSTATRTASPTPTANQTVPPTPSTPTPTPIATPSGTPTSSVTTTPSPVKTPAATPSPSSTPGSIIFVSAGNGVTSGGSPTTALSVPAPASIQTNDLILVQATDYWGNAVNPPDASWHLIRTDTLANHAVVRSFWHLATGAGDGPWTFSPSPHDYLSARASAWRNVDTATPVDSASGGATWANANSMPNAAVTPTANNETLVAYWSAFLATSQTLDAGLSPAYSANDADWATLMGYTGAPTGGVASAQYTSTSNASSNGGAGGVILLRASNGATSPTPSPTQTTSSTPGTPTPTTSPISAPTATPTVTASPARSLSATPTSTSATATPTATATTAPTGTPNAISSPTPSPSPTLISTPSTPTPTPMPTQSGTPTSSVTASPSPAQTPTATPSSSVTPGPIMFVSAGNDVTSGGSPTTALSVPAPASIQTNDLILVQTTDYWGNAVNPPDASWHLIRTDTLANHAVVRSFWHLATGAGDGPWAFSPLPHDYLSACASAWRNVDTITPVDTASSGATWANAISMPNAVVTPTANNETLVAYWSAFLATAQTLDPSLSPAYSAHDADWATLMGYTSATAAGTSSPQYTSTSNASTNGGAGGVILLRHLGG